MLNFICYYYRQVSLPSIKCAGFISSILSLNLFPFFTLQVTKYIKCSFRFTSSTICDYTASLKLSSLELLIRVIISWTSWNYLMRKIAEDVAQITCKMLKVGIIFSCIFIWIHLTPQYQIQWLCSTENYHSKLFLNQNIKLKEDTWQWVSNWFCVHFMSVRSPLKLASFSIRTP